MPPRGEGQTGRGSLTLINSRSGIRLHKSAGSLFAFWLAASGAFLRCRSSSYNQYPPEADVAARDSFRLRRTSCLRQACLFSLRLNAKSLSLFVQAARDFVVLPPAKHLTA